MGDNTRRTRAILFHCLCIRIRIPTLHTTLPTTTTCYRRTTQLPEWSYAYDCYPCSLSRRFVAFRIYGCRVVATNVSSNAVSCDMLLQIPAGALPVNNGFFTRSEHHTIGAYSTCIREYFFYFPQAGMYAHHPVGVTRDSGRLKVAQGSAQTFNVSLGHCGLRKECARGGGGEREKETSGPCKWKGRKRLKKTEKDKDNHATKSVRGGKRREKS